MTKNKVLINRGGFVLIMALWTLAFLMSIAATLGVGVRQRIGLASRLESRDKLRLLTESGIRKAAALLNQDIGVNQGHFNVSVKTARFNNEVGFKAMKMITGEVDISYSYSDGAGFKTVQRFGLLDEESKINLNQASEIVLRSLIKGVLGFSDAKARGFSEAIVSWREYSDGELSGFYSDSYYENLKDPYPSKKSKIEILDELLLIKGIDRGSFTILSRYLTVYGDGKVNINTASRPVLAALGLPEELADKVLLVRRGKDDLESTSDDYVFQKTFDIASEMRGFLKLTDGEFSMVDRLNQQQRLVTNSRFYSMSAVGFLRDSPETKIVKCVFDSAESRFVYWKEE